MCLRIILTSISRFNWPIYSALYSGGEAGLRGRPSVFTRGLMAPTGREEVGELTRTETDELLPLDFVE